MCAPALCLDRLELLEPLGVEAADDARFANRDVETPQAGVVHHDVGHPRQRQAVHVLAGVRVEHDERRSVGGAEEPVADERESVWPFARHLERLDDLRLPCVDHHDLGRLADVRVDAIAALVVQRPARASW